MSFFLAFLGFALLILLHEAGHFVAAKAVGMRVERFSLFFGPMFVKTRRGETEYGIGVLPLGGYVKITGMNPDEEYATAEIEARAYINQPPWKRIVVIAAGPVVNIVIAFLLFWVMFAASNHYVTTPQGAEIPSSTVGLVQSRAPASGLIRPGDRIVSIDGVSGRSGRIHLQIQKHECPGGAHVNGCRASTPASIAVSRDHRRISLRIRPRWDGAAKAMIIGVLFDAKTAPNGLLESAGRSVSWIGHVTGRTVSVFAQLFNSKDRGQIHSVVGSYAIATHQISLGWVSGVQIFALVSLALGLINLFPFLPLDGGHIFWALAEKVRGRRVSVRVIERASLIGMGLVGILFVIGLSNDITTLAGNGFGAQ